MKQVLINSAVYLTMMLIIAASVKAVKKSRGHKNNNPFNLIQSANNWIGKSLNPTDKRFEQFASLELGIRAGFINLLSYRRNGYNTIREVIFRYSPEADLENAPGSTKNYMNYVADKMGVPPDAELGTKEWRDLGFNIMKFENGYEVVDRYTFEQILNKYKLT